MLKSKIFLQCDHNDKSTILNMNSSFHLPQKTSGGGRRIWVSWFLLCSTRIHIVHFSQVGDETLFKHASHFLFSSRPNSRPNSRPIRRRLSNRGEGGAVRTNQPLGRGPAAQLFITHSGVRGLFCMKEDGLAHSGRTLAQRQEGRRSFLHAAKRGHQRLFARRPQGAIRKTGWTSGRRKRRSDG